jgi:hypothetical protein
MKQKKPTEHEPTDHTYISQEYYAILYFQMLSLFCTYPPQTGYKQFENLKVHVGGQTR